MTRQVSAPGVCVEFLIRRGATIMESPAVTRPHAGEDPRSKVSATDQWWLEPNMKRSHGLLSSP